MAIIKPFFNILVPYPAMVAGAEVCRIDHAAHRGRLPAAILFPGPVPVKREHSFVAASQPLTYSRTLIQF
jgi:hypothetical protein